MSNEYLVNLFLLEHQKMFLPVDISFIRSSMEQMSDSKKRIIVNSKYHNPLMVFFVSYFIGYLGIDRFIIGDTFIGILKLITLGGFGIWYIVDLFIIMNRTKCNNFRNFEILAT